VCFERGFLERTPQLSRTCWLCNQLHTGGGRFSFPLWVVISEGYRRLGLTWAYVRLSTRTTGMSSAVNQSPSDRSRFAKTVWRRT